MARLLGDDFLNGCSLDFEESAISDVDGLELLADPDDVGEPLVSASEDSGSPRAMLRVSSTGRDLKIANRCRVAGLDVAEVEGWMRRGTAVLAPRGGVQHHTAGASEGDHPSLGICVNGRAGLPGPLCNTFESRSLKCIIVASGRANHAGTGGWKGASGNHTMYGLETEHTGRERMPLPMIQVAARIQAAMIFGTAEARMVCQHWEWDLPANGGEGDKIDVATNLHPGREPSNDDFRDMVRKELQLLVGVEVSKIVYPTPNRRANGDWIRKAVKVRTVNVDNWLENHQGILQRRGPGSGVEIKPSFV